MEIADANNGPQIPIEVGAGGGNKDKHKNKHKHSESDKLKENAKDISKEIEQYKKNESGEIMISDKIDKKFKSQPESIDINIIPFEPRKRTEVNKIIYIRTIPLSISNS